MRPVSRLVVGIHLESSDQSECFIERGDLAFELGVVGGFEPLGECGTGGVAAFHEVIAGQDGFGGEPDAIGGEAFDLGAEGGGDRWMTGGGE